jgi:hypothetical protein
MEFREKSKAAFRDWWAKTQALRKRHEKELRALELEYLPFVLLSLNRYQLAFTYSAMFGKPAPSKAAEALAQLANHSNRVKVLKACYKARNDPRCNAREQEYLAVRRSTLKAGTGNRPAARRYSEKNRDLKRAASRVLRLDADAREREYASRVKHRERNYARSRAWWAGMSPETRRQYVSDQWTRRLARLKSQPGALEAYRAQKRREAAARRERIKNDPIARALDENKRKARERQRRPYHKNYFQQIKVDPLRYEKHKARRKRSQQKRQIKELLSRKDGKEALMKAITAAVPRWFPLELTADLCQEVVAALIGGEGTRQQLAALVKSKATKIRKLQSETWKQRSLHDTIPGTDNVTLLDTLSADHAHF